MLQAYIISAERVVANRKLDATFNWAASAYLTYWCRCYKELRDDCQLTEEDVEYIRTNYPELFL